MEVVQTLRESLVEERQRASARATSEERLGHALAQQAAASTLLEELRSQLDSKDRQLEEQQLRLDVAEAEVVGLGLELAAALSRPIGVDAACETHEALLDESACQTEAPVQAHVASEATVSRLDDETQTELAFDGPQESGGLADDDLETCASLLDLMGTRAPVADETGPHLQAAENVPAIDPQDHPQESVKVVDNVCLLEAAHARCAELEAALEKSVRMTEVLTDWSEHLLQVGKDRGTALEALEKRLRDVVQERDALQLYAGLEDKAQSTGPQHRVLGRLPKPHVASIYIQCSSEELCENLHARFDGDKSGSRLTWNDRRLLHSITHDLLPLAVSVVCAQIPDVDEKGLSAFLKGWNDNVVYPIVSVHRGSSSEALRSVAAAVRGVIASPPTGDSFPSKGRVQRKRRGKLESAAKENSEEAADNDTGSSSDIGVTHVQDTDALELSANSRSAIQERRMSARLLDVSGVVAPPTDNAVNEGSLLGLYKTFESEEWYDDQ